MYGQRQGKRQRPRQRKRQRHRHRQGQKQRQRPGKDRGKSKSKSRSTAKAKALQKQRQRHKQRRRQGQNRRAANVSKCLAPEVGFTRCALEKHYNSYRPSLNRFLTHMGAWYKMHTLAGLQNGYQGKSRKTKAKQEAKVKAEAKAATTRQRRNIQRTRWIKPRVIDADRPRSKRQGLDLQMLHLQHLTHQRQKVKATTQATTQAQATAEARTSDGHQCHKQLCPELGFTSSVRNTHHTSHRPCLDRLSTHPGAC